MIINSKVLVVKIKKDSTLVKLFIEDRAVVKKLTVYQKNLDQQSVEFKNRNNNVKVFFDVVYKCGNDVIVLVKNLSKNELVVGNEYILNLIIGKIFKRHNKVYCSLTI